MVDFYGKFVGKSTIHGSYGFETNNFKDKKLIGQRDHPMSHRYTFTVYEGRSTSNIFFKYVFAKLFSYTWNRSK